MQEARSRETLTRGVKQMDRDQKYYISMLSIIAIAVVLFSIVVSSCEKKIYTARINAGYEQVTAIGYNGYLWQKSK